MSPDEEQTNEAPNTEAPAPPAPAAPPAATPVATGAATPPPAGSPAVATPAAQASAAGSDRQADERRPEAPRREPRDRGGRDDDDERGGGRRRYFGRRKVCTFCVDKAKSVDYKDPDKLRRFVSDRGRIETRRRTGTCAKHQRWLATALKRARHLALLPYSPGHIRLMGTFASRR